MRLDAFLVANGLCRSRATAAESVKTSCVTVNGRTVTKPSFEVNGDEDIQISSVNEKYVSRGGYKLEAALDAFDIDVTGHICVDIGASTGGFTDCLLQRGASSVLAIDSGSDQLDGRIAADPRVTSLENTNIRTFVPKEKHFADFICVDVSFISLKYVLPPLRELLKEKGTAVCLIKPQFEAGRQDVGKKGIVRDPAVYKRVILDIVTWAGESGLNVISLIPSPITGGDGNIEFLCKLGHDGKPVGRETVNDIVDKATKTFRGK